MIRTGTKALMILSLLLIAATPATAGRIFVDAELGQGWLSPGGFPSEAVACEFLTDIHDFNDIDYAPEFSGRLGFRFSDSIEAGLSFTLQNHDHVFSSSDGINDSMRKYNFPASWYELFLSYSPWQKGRLRLDVGGSAGMVSIDGTSDYSIIEVGPMNARFVGDAISFSGYTTAELTLAKNASLLMRVGYRQATISDWEDPDGNMIEFDGYDFEFDFSGVFTRVGVRLFIN